MLWRTGFLSRPLTRLQIHIASLSFESVVWIISSRCVLELKYGKAGIPVFFSHQASTGRTLPLMNTMPCLSVSKTVSWIFWQLSSSCTERTWCEGPFKCCWCLHQKATWASSRVLGMQYWINRRKILITFFCNARFIVGNAYRMVHAFTGAGVLPSHYTKWHRLVEVMLMLDEAWMAIHLLSY